MLLVLANLDNGSCSGFDTLEEKLVSGFAQEFGCILTADWSTGMIAIKF